MADKRTVWVLVDSEREEPVVAVFSDMGKVLAYIARHPHRAWSAGAIEVDAEVDAEVDDDLMNSSLS